MKTEKQKIRISCKRCNSLILRDILLDYLKEEFQMPAMNQSGSNDDLIREKLSDFWVVDDMLKFENVGFTNTFENVKYLICADCEIGPIGFTNLNTPNKFFVAIERVESKPAE